MAANTTVKISRQDLQDLAVPPEAVITGIKDLSSYNWVESARPTIAVPGSPDLWSPPRGACKVRKDSGHIYIAQNAARHPASPLEPLFRALYVAHPSFDVRPVDLVSDRNNIRKLLSVINPSSSKNGLEDFTINVEVAGRTVILARDEAKVEEFVGAGVFRGFGHEFEKKYTRAQLRGATGHHRIISYRFGDMNFLIRHETDGFVRADLKSAPADAQAREQEKLLDELASLSLSSLSLGTNYRHHHHQTLRVKKEGTVVPRESTLEIKTRVATKPIDFDEIATQLWASQTPKLVRAYHSRGVFQEPAVEDVAEDIKGWERANQAHLRRLAALIAEILRVARGMEGGRMRIRYGRAADEFVIQQRSEGKKMLPGDLYSRWEEKAGGLDVHETETAAAEPSGEGKDAAVGKKLVTV
ncbi:hypothetical protein KVR01_011765 [Diaporthe batatas]|uniref:uncharacterized protein n=1 Tax=Diaporthe batatas TaxID=748121 RepID=UPI001D05A49F|nr:uncharacterized protein KVR01_011765 [Diaporthe batatas]KAG8158643.1 hypothetical protein KVR01_011765 [Diaporthe batatas]